MRTPAPTGNQRSSAFRRHSLAHQRQQFVSRSPALLDVGEPAEDELVDAQPPVVQQLVGHLLRRAHQRAAAVDPDLGQTIPQVPPKAVVFGFAGLGLLSDHGGADDGGLTLRFDLRRGVSDETARGIPRRVFVVANYQVGSQPEGEGPAGSRQTAV